MRTVQHTSSADVLAKADEIAALLISSEEMQRFRQAEEKITHHGDAQALLFVVKAKRNQYSQLSLRHGFEHPAVIKAKQEYDSVLQQIAQIPLIDELQTAQEDLNDVVQGILHTLVSSVANMLPLEKGEEPGGAASGGCGNCSSGGCGRH
ncbi:YlbF family regulator [Tumebacillus lipolyticus]|uniref:YlbF family regulator n=1 Tax=Tumebacillus lipolyticus TaxID=1280370 RepID=A0ABW5A1J0_9BACL